jgi:glutaminyl-tRNA synthetase
MVDGWDDPRMPTLCGLRRRGYTPASILEFVKRAGVAKANSLVDIELLEHCIREELNTTAERRIAILDPIKVVITNYPEDKVEYFPASNNPSDPEAGTRDLPFTRELYIDRSDFAEVPPPKFFRLKPDGEVRLMNAYIIRCNEVVKDENGEIVELRCTCDPETGGKNPTDGRKIKGTIHWLSAAHAKDVDVMLYDHLFTIENTGDIPEDKTYDDYLNPQSLQKITHAKIEASAFDAQPGERFQFVRTGYFAKDTKYPNTFNRIVTLKDSYRPQA